MMVKQFLLLLVVVSFIKGLDNGLGKTPQMGWNTWNKFGCNITEDLYIQTVDLIIQIGLDKLGYNYINLDDCWMEAERDPGYHMQISSQNFPGGIKPLADYAHSKGLKFGLYSSAGTHTCEGKAGSLGHEEIDAQDWASWGVDYLKYDNCFNKGVPATQRYAAMRDALNKTGRPIFYSICNWGFEGTPNWAPELGNSWRTTADIANNWKSVRGNFYNNAKDRFAASPGGWNDPDMLEIGNNNLTIDEEKTHFALWAISKSPLIIGCDLYKVQIESLEILMNKDLIDVNQDTGSQQAYCAKDCSDSLNVDDGTYGIMFPDQSVWTTKTQNGDAIVVVVNWKEQTLKGYKFYASDVGILPRQGELVEIYDMWEHKVINTLEDTDQQLKITVPDIPAHGCQAYRLRIVQKVKNLPFKEFLDKAL